MMRQSKIKSYGMIVSLLLLFLFGTTGCNLEDLVPLLEGDTPQVQEGFSAETPSVDDEEIDESGVYTTKEEVSKYLHLYGELPENFITKNKAKDLGWEASRGNLFEVTDEKSIGGDRFYNREGGLPDKEGRKWFEADIDYRGGSRGAKRILYSNDGLIFYTGDHYDTFEKLYGEE